MAEVAAVGLASSIVQFVDFSSRVLYRLHEFHSRNGEIPKSFKQIKDELPILLETLKQTKLVAEKAEVGEEVKNALLQIVEKCGRQITQLDRLISDSLPQEGDSWGKKTGKALSSLRQDPKVDTITHILRKQLQCLTHYHISALSMYTIYSRNTPNATPTGALSNSDKHDIDTQKRGQGPSLKGTEIDRTHFLRNSLITMSDTSSDCSWFTSWNSSSSSSLTGLSLASGFNTSSGIAIRRSPPESEVKAIIRIEIEAVGSHQEVIYIDGYCPFQEVYEGLIVARNTVLLKEKLEPRHYQGVISNAFIFASGLQDDTFPFNSTFLKAVLEQFADNFYTSVTICATFSERIPERELSSIQLDLLAELEAAKVLGADGQFIPLIQIKSILGVDRIQELFLEHYSHYNAAIQIRQVSEQVSQQAPRLLATLILARLIPLVPHFLNFWEHGFSDSSMPLDISQLPPFCRRIDYDLICALQSQTLVAEISLFTNQVATQDLPCLFRLPFIDKTEIARGGYSSVFECTPFEDKEPALALKRLFSNSEHDFLREVETLRVVSQLNHPHLIKLLGSFRYRGKYHLVFPLASGSLTRLLIENDPSQSLIRWMWKQLVGVADALHCFHTLAVEQSMVDPSAHCRHGDLKPENILFFSASDSRYEPGLLVIADLGTATFHTHPVTRREVRRDSFQGTLSYAAPESDVRFLERSTGSLYDIWAFGAILSEIVAWHLGGSHEIDVFRTERKGHVLLGPNQKMPASPFWHHDLGEFRVSPAVSRRLQAMVERAIEIFGESGVQAAEEIAGLVNTCLSIDPDRRPSARIVADRLKEVARSLETVEDEDPTPGEGDGKSTK